jgi:putative oxidoreductase
MTPLRTAARAMLAAIFVSEGISALRKPDPLLPKAKPLTDRLAPALKSIHPQIPTDPATLVRINGAVQVAGGLLLARGKATSPAALVLASSLVPTTILGYRFWEAEGPAQRQAERLGFLKNVGLLGGLIFAALDNDGRPSVAWRAEHLAHRAQRMAVHEKKSAQRKLRSAWKKLPTGS